MAFSSQISHQLLEPPYIALEILGVLVIHSLNLTLDTSFKKQRARKESRKQFNRFKCSVVSDSEEIVCILRGGVGIRCAIILG